MEFLDNIHKAVSHQILTNKVKNALKGAVSQSGKSARRNLKLAENEAGQEGARQALEKLETAAIKILRDFTRDQVKIATSALWWEIEVRLGLAKLGLTQGEEIAAKNKETLQSLDLVLDHEIESLSDLRGKGVNLPSHEWLARNLYLTVYNHAGSLTNNPQENNYPPEIKEILIPAAKEASDIIKSHAQEKIASLSENSNRKT